jgi:hypothetical protein
LRCNIEQNKKKERRDTETDAFLPVWFQLPRSFYVRLVETANETGLSSAAILKEGLNLFREKHLRKHQPQLVSPEKSDAASILARKQWTRLTPKERSERARALAQKRWKKAESEGK